MVYEIIVNAARCPAKHIETVTGVFKNAGKQYRLHYTDHKGHATGIARQLTSSGEECALVVMGGDGTLHEVLNGISDFERCSLGLYLRARATTLPWRREFPKT